MSGIEEEFDDIRKRLAKEPPSDIERGAERADAEELAELRIELKNKQAELDRAQEIIDALQGRSLMFEARGDRARERANHDKLTALLNKAGFERQVSNLLEWFAMEAAGSEQRTTVGIALNIAVMDLDDFKFINDTYGHPAGDAALQHVADILKLVMRENDKVGRWGGDEFAVAFMSPEVGGDVLARNAITVTRKILNALSARPFVWEGVEIPMRASIGAAKLKPGETYEELFARADGAAGVAKRRGKNSAVIAEVEEAEALGKNS